MNPFDRMMKEMNADQSRGFANVLKDSEAQALESTSLSAAEEKRVGRSQRDRREQVLGRLAQLQRCKPRADLGRFADHLKDRTIKQL